jgi:hypothetical protein
VFCDGTAVDIVNIADITNGSNARIARSVKLAQTCSSVIANADGVLFALAGGLLHRIGVDGSTVLIPIEPLSGISARLLWAGRNNLLLSNTLGNLVALTLPSSLTRSLSQPQFSQLGAAVTALKALSSPTGYFAATRSTVAFGSFKGTSEAVATLSNLS